VLLTGVRDSNRVVEQEACGAYPDQPSAFFTGHRVTVRRPAPVLARRFLCCPFRKMTGVLIFGQTQSHTVRTEMEAVHRSFCG